MRFSEFKNKKDEPVNEILPAIGAIAGAAARAVGGMAVKKLASSGLKKGAKAAAGMGMGMRKDSQSTNSPNSTVGTQPSSVKSGPFTNTDADTIGSDTATKTGNANTNDVDNQLKTGKMIRLPSQTVGGKARADNFKITRSDSKEIEIQNPRPGPGEPRKFTFKKDDLRNIMTR